MRESLAVGVKEVLSLPWHWIRATQMLEYVEGVMQAGSLDVEGLILPREYWFRKDKAEAWYKDREEIRRDK